MSKMLIYSKYILGHNLSKHLQITFKIKLVQFYLQIDIEIIIDRKN